MACVGDQALRWLLPHSGPELLLFLSAGTAATMVVHWLARALVRHCSQQQGCFLGIRSL